MLKTQVLGKTGIYKVQYSGNFSRKGMLTTYNDGFSEKLGATLKNKLYHIMPSVPKRVKREPFLFGHSLGEPEISIFNLNDCCNYSRSAASSGYQNCVVALNLG